MARTDCYTPEGFMWRELDAATQYDAGGGRGVVSEFAGRMRELGIPEEA